MKHNAMRPLSLILAIWMFIIAIPVTVFAELLSMTTQPMTDDTVYVLAEDNTKRTAFEKHYYCSDGTFVAVTYPEAVHYQNDQGEWMDVDLRLSENSVTNTYESQSGGFKTVFTQSGINSGSDISVMAGETVHSSIPTVSMETENHALSWSLVGAMPATGQASAYAMNTANVGSNAVISASANAEMQVNGEMKTSQPAFAVEKVAVTDPNAFALSSVSNQVIYENVFGQDQNVSVRYSVSLNKIEEDILITAPTEMTSFSMQVECGTLNPVLNADNSVEFLDNQGQMVYHVSTPYLADAAFAISYDVDVTLSVQNGTCTITYTPDAEWMNAPERQYPIMLDPAVTTKDYSAAITDTYVEQGVNTPMGTQQWLYIQNTTDVKRAAVFKINTLPTVDPSLPIISARFSFSAMSAPFQEVYMKLELLKEDFSFGTDTYSTLLQKEKEYLNASYMISGNTGISFDVSDAIFQLYSEAPYDTFVLSYYDDNDTTFCYPICSSSNSSINARPYLTVTYGYTLPEDLLNSEGEDTVISLCAGYGGYLSCNNENTTNGADVYHQYTDELGPLYEFVLEENASTGGYTLRYNYVSTAPKLTVNLTTKRVVFSTEDNPVTQEWLIIPYSTYDYKIVLKSDMSYVLTSLDSSGTAAASSDIDYGKVGITPCSNTVAPSQRWSIEIDGEYIRNDALPSNLKNGEYYINNLYNATFLHHDRGSLNSKLDALSDLGNHIKWRVTNLGDGYITIQAGDDASYFLGVSSTTGSSATMLVNISSSTIPDRCKWRVYTSSRGCKLQNKYNSKYLYVTSSSNPSYVSTYSNAITGNLSKQQTWRFVKVSDYRQLTDEAEFKDLVIQKGHNKAVQLVTNSTGANFARPDSDFTYSGYDNTVISVSEQGVVTGLDYGSTTVYATHDITGLMFAFEVDIVPAFAAELTTTYMVDPDAIEKTDDGFYMLNVPLSEIFMNNGVESLLDIYLEDGVVVEDVYSVELYYDDWYLYAIETDEGLTYSLLKMREQEYDGGDSDDPGVSVSFIELNISDLLLVLQDPTSQNKVACDNIITDIIGKGELSEAIVNSSILNYYADHESLGSYFIAKQYIEKILNISMNNGVIPLPNSYSNLEPGIKGLTSNYDQNATIIVDGSICLSENTTYNTLTLNEKNIIILTHTGAMSLNGFASEIEVHADMHFIPILDGWCYEDIIVADLTVLGTHDKEFFAGLYSEGGLLGYIERHIAYHGREPI